MVMSKELHNQTVQDINVYCTKETCGFELNWYGATPEYALKFYKYWNTEHHDKMNCVHNYAIRPMTKRRERSA